MFIRQIGETLLEHKNHKEDILLGAVTDCHHLQYGDFFLAKQTNLSEVCADRTNKLGFKEHLYIKIGDIRRATRNAFDKMKDEEKSNLMDMDAFSILVCQHIFSMSGSSVLCATSPSTTCIAKHKQKQTVRAWADSILRSACAARTSGTGMEDVGRVAFADLSRKPST